MMKQNLESAEQWTNPYERGRFWSGRSGLQRRPANPGIDFRGSTVE